MSPVNGRGTESSKKMPNFTGRQPSRRPAHASEMRSVHSRNQHQPVIRATEEAAIHADARRQGQGGREDVFVLRWRLSSWAASLALALAGPGFAQSTPAGLKVAFTGDQGLGEDPESVLRLVLDEDAEALFVQGDFDYADDPEAWDAMLTSVLGPNFPVIAVVGNHDEARWDGAGGYQDRLTQRMQRIGLGWTGELGVQATLRYKGLFVVQTAPDVFDDGYDHAAFIRTSLAADGSIWSISAWHKLMTEMNVGGKGDET